MNVVGVGAAVWLAAGALLAGCSVHNEASGRYEAGSDSEGTKPALRVQDPRFPETRARLNNAGIVDDALRYKIAVEGTSSRRTPTDTLEVWAELRNRTDHPLQVECRVRWYDSAQASIDQPSAWQRVYLEANSFETYREFSTDVYNVTYYYIEIREGR